MRNSLQVISIDLQNAAYTEIFSYIDTLSGIINDIERRLGFPDISLASKNFIILTPRSAVWLKRLSRCMHMLWDETLSLLPKFSMTCDLAEQLYIGDVDRMSADSTSRASFKSIRSLSKRIRRTISSISADHREYASIPPSQVIRRSSSASAECRIFPEFSDIRSVAAESDAMSWKSEASFLDAE